MPCLLYKEIKAIEEKKYDDTINEIRRISKCPLIKKAITAIILDQTLTTLRFLSEASARA